MQNHSEFFILFSRYWWLLFALSWIPIRIAQAWSRHQRANRTIDIIKSYVDQGKEPPPELLKVLQQPPEEMRARDYRRRGFGWVPVFLFGALAIAFVMLGVMEGGGMKEADGLYFVAIIMTGLCLGFLVSTLNRPRLDQDRNPPQ